MQQRVNLSDFDEWKDSFITKRYFDFLRFEAELARRMLASGEIKGDTTEKTGKAYEHMLLQIEVYERLADDVRYEDLFPQEEINESNEDGGSLGAESLDSP